MHPQGLWLRFLVLAFQGFGISCAGRRPGFGRESGVISVSGAGTGSVLSYCSGANELGLKE